MTTVTQFWLHPSAPVDDFVESFRIAFPQGVAERIPLVPDAHPMWVRDGSPYFELQIPTEQMSKLELFLEEFAQRHGLLTIKGPASGFGFQHAG